MPDKKLTDAEIVKACKDCLHYDACKGTYSSAKGDEDILYEFDGEMYAESGCEDFKDKDLINRLQAENERLKVEYEESQKRNSDLVNAFQGYKAEAYKECIEKVKTEIDEALKNNYKVRSERAQSIPIYTEDEFWNYCTGKIGCLRGLDDFCDNLSKELVGEPDES